MTRRSARADTNAVWELLLLYREVTGKLPGALTIMRELHMSHDRLAAALMRLQRHRKIVYRKGSPTRLIEILPEALPPAAAQEEVAPAPTQWAYDQACAALRKHEEEEKIAKAEVERLRIIINRLTNPLSPPEPEHNTIVTLLGHPLDYWLNLEREAVILLGRVYKALDAVNWERDLQQDIAAFLAASERRG